MTPAIDPLQGIDPAALDRVVLVRHASASAWTEAVAAELDAILRHDLDVNGRARLLLSGGSTPSPVLRALAQRKLDWTNVEVGLVDERWLSPKDPDSNAYLVRDTLLFDGGPPQLAGTPFSPLVRPGQSRSDSVHAANTHARHAVRASAAVLGMGPDGHTASLFPGSRDLGRVLASQEPYQALDATGCPVAGDYTQRITLTPAGLAQASTRLLLLRGADKLAVLRRALEGDDVTEYPVRVAIALPGAPLRVHWAA